MKRFYKKVAASPVEGANYEVHLDGRPVRTPMRHALQLPGAALARAVADEWDAQGEEIDVETMPMTRIAATAIDRVRHDRDVYTDQIAAYAETDLLCYRAPSPSGLVVLQSKAWQPLLDWSREIYGAVLKATEGLSPIEQDRDALARLRKALDDHDEFVLAAVSVATAASGSLVLALALAQQRIDAREAYDASQLDESYQNQKWGVDPEAQQRRNVLKADLEASATFLALLREG